MAHKSWMAAGSDCLWLHNEPTSHPTTWSWAKFLAFMSIVYAWSWPEATSTTLHTTVVYLGSNSKESSALLVGFSRRKYWREWEAPRIKATTSCICTSTWVCWFMLVSVITSVYCPQWSKHDPHVYFQKSVYLLHPYWVHMHKATQRRGSASHETNEVRRTAIAFWVTVCFTLFKGIVNFKEHCSYPIVFCCNGWTYTHKNQRDCLPILLVSVVKCHNMQVFGASWNGSVICTDPLPPSLQFPLSMYHVTQQVMRAYCSLL